MGIGSLLILILVGAIAGWLASQFMRGRSFGLLGNIVIGVLGAIVGGWLFGVVGFQAYGLLARIISATVGAVILLYLARYFRRA